MLLLNNYDYSYCFRGQIVSLAARLHRYVHHDAAAVSHGLLLAFWGYTADYDGTFVLLSTLYMPSFSVYEYGDDITSYGDSDRVLVMVNHQSTADVPTLFTALQHKGVAARKVSYIDLYTLSTSTAFLDAMADGRHVQMDAVWCDWSDAWRLFYSTRQSNTRS